MRKGMKGIQYKKEKKKRNKRKRKEKRKKKENGKWVEEEEEEERRRKEGRKRRKKGEGREGAMTEKGNRKMGSGEVFLFLRRRVCIQSTEQSRRKGKGGFGS